MTHKRSIFKTVDELNALTTPRLLAYFRAERARYNKWKYYQACECCGEFMWDLQPNDEYNIKQKARRDEWDEYLAVVKTILAARPHVPANLFTHSKPTQFINKI